MDTYKNSERLSIVNRENVKNVGKEDLSRVYYALRDRINITFDEFVNGKSEEYDDIRVSAINTYVIGNNLLNSKDPKIKKAFQNNLRIRYELLAIHFIGDANSKAANYVAERFDELKQLSPKQTISYEDLKQYCLRRYDIIEREFAEFKKKMDASVKIENGKDYDKYLEGLVNCSREEYVLGETENAKKIREGLRASISAYEVVKRYTILGNNPEMDNVVSYLGDLNDIDATIRKIFKHYLEVDKLNAMGYERLKATSGEDLVAYMTSLDKFKELVNIEDENIQRQIPEVFMIIKSNPKLVEKYGSILGLPNYESIRKTYESITGDSHFMSDDPRIKKMNGSVIDDSYSMSVDLMKEIYHCLIEVNDMNSYKGINIDAADYMFLNDEQRDKVKKERVLFQMRKRFEKMTDSELSKFLTQKTNMFLLDKSERRDYLSRARNIVLNSIDITAQVIDNEEVLDHVEELLGRRTPTAVFEFVNNAQVSRFMYRKMYGEDFDLKNIDNLCHTHRIAAEFCKFKENQRKEEIKENIDSISKFSEKHSREAVRYYNNVMFDERIKKLLSDTFSYLSQKYSGTISNEDLYEKIIIYLGEFIRSREHDYKIFDELTPEIIEQAIFGKKDEFDYMFDVIPEERAIISRRL